MAFAVKRSATGKKSLCQPQAVCMSLFLQKKKSSQGLTGTIPRWHALRLVPWDNVCEALLSVPTIEQ